MKLGIVVATMVVGVFAVAGAAQAQQSQDAAAPQATPTMQQNADATPPSTVDSTSYGGMPGGTSMAAGAQKPMAPRAHVQGQCSAAPNCDIFFGQ
ncbi:hypothetical protein AWB81_06705 [Caballeronia arationis]|uniref:hypothetical protein n=1 Tax=Caballeronia arationis TaxID=1777142 RepID=UPI00074C498F|nr:hypothetical protein [Caballeronia arationis]SAL04454.1 hypothetical protein AWB81_06705 [Caballeronia arationis]